jgi:hypothetical protein
MERMRLATREEAAGELKENQTKYLHVLWSMSWMILGHIMGI